MAIGSELCRLIMKWDPKRLVLFEASKFALYQIERELQAVACSPIEAVLATITDSVSVEGAISRFDVETAFHAAAYKNVPLVEANVQKGIHNNLFWNPGGGCGGSQSGCAELIIGRQSKEAATEGTVHLFWAVRLGNVLGSNGSVVPLIREQIARGGPVTLTDAAMTRYFMSIHEAAELIVQAGALSKGSDVFLLDMESRYSSRTLRRPYNLGRPHREDDRRSAWRNRDRRKRQATGRENV